MSTRVSILKRSILPRTRSLMRGCVTPNSLAASAWVRPRLSISFRIAIMSEERILRRSASSSSNPRSAKTFPLERVIFIEYMASKCVAKYHLSFRGVEARRSERCLSTIQYQSLPYSSTLSERSFSRH